MNANAVMVVFLILNEPVYHYKNVFNQIKTDFRQKIVFTFTEEV